MISAEEAVDLLLLLANLRGQLGRQAAEIANLKAQLSELASRPLSEPAATE